MGNDVLLSGEVAGFVLGVLVALVAVGVAAFVLRNRAIGRGHPTYLVSLERDGHFRLGQAQVRATSVRWYPMRGVSVRPSDVWRRGELELGPPMTAPRGSSITLADPVRVECTAGEDTFLLVIGRDGYTALRSWTESAPPGIHVDVA